MKFTTTKESCSIEGGDCCTPEPQEKTECPECGNLAKAVLAKTLNSLLTKKCKEQLDSLEGFYYCKTPSCKVVYFKKNTLLTQESLSVTVGLKEGANPATLCYCFGWTKEKIEEELKTKGETIALNDIKAKMENPGCNCEILNPSGGCCLGDVSKAIKEIKASL